MKVIGIDLGTTRSLIAHIDQADRPAVIFNAESEVLTPSIILLKEEEGEIKATVGRAAKMSMVARPEDTVSIVKRHMKEPDWVFVDSRGKEWRPETLSALILKKLRKDAEEKLGEKITHAVITVPYYFADLERKRTQQAGKIAGLEVPEGWILDEPIAAVYAYTLDTGLKPMTCCVYDFGGGTFDVSIVEVTSEKKVAVKATAGNSNLGGEDLDAQIVRYFAEKFKEKHNMDPMADKRTHYEFLQRAEWAKELLSDQDKVDIPLGAGGKSLDLTFIRKRPVHFKITERTFENLKSEGFPDDVLEKLESIKNQEPIGEEEFVGILKTTIGDEQTEKFKSLILEHTKVERTDKTLEELISTYIDMTISSMEDALIYYRARRQVEEENFPNDTAEERKKKEERRMEIIEDLERIRAEDKEEEVESEWKRIKGEEWERIDKILLVGGSSKIPLVSRRIEEETGKEPELTDPDQAVVRGAAIQAAWLAKEAGIPCRQPRGRTGKPGVIVKPEIIVSHSLGVKAKKAPSSEEFINSKIIFKGATIPEDGVEGKEMYVADVDGQTAVEITLLQKEAEDPKYCVVVGSFLFEGIPPRPAGVVKIIIKLKYDRQNMVHVEAYALETEKRLEDITEEDLKGVPKLKTKVEAKWLTEEKIETERNLVSRM